MYQGRLASDVAIILFALGSFLFVCSRWLALRVSRQLPAEKEELKRWHAVKWNQLRSSRWLQLPEHIIHWLGCARDSLSRTYVLLIMNLAISTFPLFTIFILWVRADRHRISFLPHKAAFVVTGLVLYTAALFSAAHGRRRILIGMLVSLTALAAYVCAFDGLDAAHGAAVVLSVVSAWEAPKILPTFWDSPLAALGEASRSKNYLGHYQSHTSILFPLVILAVVVVCLQHPSLLLGVLSNASLGRAVLAAVLLFPFIGFVTGFLSQGLGLIAAWNLKGSMYVRVADTFLLFGLSVGLSFSVTLFAMFIGHRFNPQALIPQTQRMLWSNAIFDGFHCGDVVVRSGTRRF